MRLPPPSKAQEQMISEVHEAKVRYNSELERWTVEYEGRQYVGYGRDWYQIGKNSHRPLKKVGKGDVIELNEFVTYAIVERTLREKRRDSMF